MVCWVEEQVCASASNMLQPTAVLVLALILHLHSESPRGCWAAVWLTWISKVCGFDWDSEDDWRDLNNFSSRTRSYWLACVGLAGFSETSVWNLLLYSQVAKEIWSKIDRGAAQTWFSVCSSAAKWFNSILAAFLVLEMLLEVLPLRALVPAWHKPGGEGERLDPACCLPHSYQQ